MRTVGGGGPAGGQDFLLTPCPVCAFLASAEALQPRASDQGGFLESGPDGSYKYQQ